MWYNPLIAAGGGDIFPLIIIVVVIVAQLIKAVKGPKPTVTKPGSQPAEDGTFVAPEDELKKFLESLSGGGSSSKPEQPVPVPTQPRQKPREIRVIEPVKPVTIRTARVKEPDYAFEEPFVPEVAAPPPLPVAAARQTAAFSEASPARITDKTPHIRSQIVGELTSRHSIRKAIVLREILGPCFALRRT